MGVLTTRMALLITSDIQYVWQVYRVSLMLPKLCTAEGVVCMFDVLQAHWLVTIMLRSFLQACQLICSLQPAHGSVY